MRFTRLLSVAVVVSSLSLASAACSSSSSSGGGGGDCGSFASAVCSKLASCFPFGLEVSYGTTTECTSRFTLLCQNGMQEPGVTMSSAWISKCTTAYSAAGCDVVGGGTPSECLPSPGTFANGQACGDDAQCQSLFCNKPSGASCGACATAPKAGDACTASCGVGLNCTNGHCVAPTTPGALGAQCSATAKCGTALTCFNGTCATPTAGGQACDQTKPACDAAQGYTCMGGVCSQVKAANPGEACGLNGSQYTLCAAGGHCKMNTGSTTGTCLAPAADGQACDTTNGPDCKTGASCVNGVCTIDSGTTCH
jgi:hypothetical protein